MWVQLLDEEVAVGAVAVSHDDIRARVCVQDAADGGVDLASHQPPGRLVLRVSGSQLLAPDYASDAFKIGRDENTLLDRHDAVLPVAQLDAEVIPESS